MAIKINFNWQGIQLNEVYVRVIRVMVEPNEMFIYLGYFGPENDKGLRGLLTFKDVNVLYDLAGFNPIKQAYEHLKTLPEFEGAVDC